MAFNYQQVALSAGSINGYKLSELKMSHTEHIRKWRNAQMDVLRQKKPITREQQRKYFSDKIFPDLKTTRPQNILFSLLKQNVLVGYGGLVHVSWEDRRAEVSFLVAPERTKIFATYEEDFSTFLALLKSLAFCQLNFKRLYTETYSFRKAHVGILEKNGFQLEGTLRGHIILDGHHYDSLIHGAINAIK